MNLWAQDISGTWQQIDDKTGAKAIIVIEKKQIILTQARLRKSRHVQVIHHAKNVINVQPLIPINRF